MKCVLLGTLYNMAEEYSSRARLAPPFSAFLLACLSARAWSGDAKARASLVVVVEVQVLVSWPP
jgi:hypothetical protein